jgi:hypothetical protein
MKDQIRGTLGRVALKLLHDSEKLRYAAQPDRRLRYRKQRANIAASDAAVKKYEDPAPHGRRWCGST